MLQQGARKLGRPLSLWALEHSFVVDASLQLQVTEAPFGKLTHKYSGALLVQSTYITTSLSLSLIFYHITFSKKVL